jgi:branched-chain amino acid transport system substrate-binding protein
MTPRTKETVVYIRHARQAAVAAAATALLLAGCASAGSGSVSGGGSGSPITLGTTLPLTGPLASFGPVMEAGYQKAIDDINASGGVSVGGVKRKLTLKVLDNASDPNNATQQARELIQSDGATALLGSFSPDLNNPVSTVAQQLHVPVIMTVTPIQAWRLGNASGWTYAWDVFDYEPSTTSLFYKTATALVPSNNRKVAIFADTENDGIQWAKLWKQEAPQYGYQVAYVASFPPGTSDFSQYVQQAKASGAQVLLAQMLPPDGIALWKQIHAYGWKPSVAACNKCSASSLFPKDLGSLAQGTLNFGWWTPDDSYPGDASLVKYWEPSTGNDISLEMKVTTYTITEILAHAITAARSTSGPAINKALGKTDMETPIGHITFTDNAYETPDYMLQWQGNSQLRIFPLNVKHYPYVTPGLDNP